jgi:ubiquinone/menaquinone biosynthesis C-methylase UbiE
MAQPQEQFIPALGADFLTPLYDVVARFTGERRMKERIIAQARIGDGDEVLDLGCGTGTLVLMAQQACPTARVAGMDIDPKILAIARRKLERAGVTAPLKQGSATDPPFPSHSFDRVLTTLMVHHLTTEQKVEAFRAVRRLLRPGGSLHIADFGKPHNALMRAAGAVFGLFHGAGGTVDANLRGELPAMIADAGFKDVVLEEPWMTPFGTVDFIRATAP